MWALMIFVFVRLTFETPTTSGPPTPAHFFLHTTAPLFFHLFIFSGNSAPKSDFLPPPIWPPASKAPPPTPPPPHCLPPLVFPLRQKPPPPPPPPASASKAPHNPPCLPPPRVTLRLAVERFPHYWPFVRGFGTGPLWGVTNLPQRSINNVFLIVS